MVRPVPEVASPVVPGLSPPRPPEVQAAQACPPVWYPSEPVGPYSSVDARRPRSAAAAPGRQSEALAEPPGSPLRTLSVPVPEDCAGVVPAPRRVKRGLRFAARRGPRAPVGAWPRLSLGLASELRASALARGAGFGCRAAFAACPLLRPAPAVPALQGRVAVSSVASPLSAGPARHPPGEPSDARPALRGHPRRPRRRRPRRPSPAAGPVAAPGLARSTNHLVRAGPCPCRQCRAPAAAVVPGDAVGVEDRGGAALLAAPRPRRSTSAAACRGSRCFAFAADSARTDGENSCLECPCPTRFDHRQRRRTPPRPSLPTATSESAERGACGGRGAAHADARRTGGTVIVASCSRSLPRPIVGRESPPARSGRLWRAPGRPGRLQHGEGL